MSEPTYKGLGGGSPLGRIITTADILTPADAFKTHIIIGGTNGSTYLVPSTGLVAGMWFEFFIVNDADSNATIFGPRSTVSSAADGGVKNVDVILADTTGRFVQTGSTEEGASLIRLTAILEGSSQRYSVSKQSGEILVSPGVLTT